VVSFLACGRAGKSLIENEFVEVVTKRKENRNVKMREKSRRDPKVRPLSEFTGERANVKKEEGKTEKDEEEAKAAEEEVGSGEGREEDGKCFEEGYVGIEVEGKTLLSYFIMKLIFYKIS
jgi:hypothetical protein